MVEVKCLCGKVTYSGEASAGQSLPCTACGQPLHLACGETLEDGQATGDFDAFLELKHGPDVGCKAFYLGGVAEIAIGKRAENQIPLPGSQVSRAHCKLVRQDFAPSRWKLVDTDSRNGVFVNGKRVTEVDLNPGDQVTVGEYTLVYRVAEPQPVAPAPAAAAPGAVCPSCGKSLPPKAKLCVDCGIDIKTGRAMVVSHEFDENDFAIRADTWIRLVSWIVPFGLFPVASEALGLKRPIATWVIACLTFVTSVAFFVALKASDQPSVATMNLMMWSGTPKPVANEVPRK